LAGWGIRLGGFVIDGVILYVFQFILGVLLHRNQTLRVHFTMTRTDGSVQHNSISLLVFLLAGLVYLAYGAIMIGGRGQTVGMMAVGIRAVRAEDDGPVGLGRALGRAVVQLVLSWTAIFGLLSGLFPLWDKRRQTLQDKAARTLVVRSRSVG
jgi:uncharacterized RDD family membrane protein YckC